MDAGGAGWAGEARDGEGEEGFVVAVEGEAFVGFLLEEFSAEEKEEQSGEGIEVAFATAADDFINTLREQRGDAGGDGDINREHALAQADPRGAPVVGGAEEEDGQREDKAEVAEEFLQTGTAEAIKSEVGRDAEEHDVAEGEAGDGKLQPEAARNGAAGGGRSVEVGEFEVGFVAERSEERGDFAEFDAGGVEGDGGFLAREIHLRGADAGLELEQVFEQPHARDAVNGGEAEGDVREAGVGEIDEAGAGLGGVEIGELAGSGGAGDADAGGVAEAVEIGEAVFREQFKNGAAALAAEGVAGVREGGRGARCAAVAAGIAAGGDRAR